MSEESFDVETINILAERLRDAARAGGESVESALDLLVGKAKVLIASRDRAQAKLDAICDINENDWDDGSAASWVSRIMNGETVEALVKDGMVTQEMYEDSCFKRPTAVPDAPDTMPSSTTDAAMAASER
jgi:hypothetical protein